MFLWSPRLKNGSTKSWVVVETALNEWREDSSMVIS